MASLSFFLILFASICATTIASTPPAVMKYLHQCAEDMGVECGKQVYNKLFTSNVTEVTEDCCYKILQTGYYCHTKMSLFILETNPRYKNEEWMHYLTNGDEIYQTCDVLTKPEDPRFLGTCVEEIGAQCGKEVFYSIVNDKSMSNECCGKLVKMGQKCHINMAKALIRTPEMRKVDAVKFLERNLKVFFQCKNRK
ncbi:unnamed protein product [Lathyrus oleraceus]